MRVATLRILSCAALVAKSSSSHSKSTAFLLLGGRSSSFVAANTPYSTSSLAMADEVKKAQDAAALADGSPLTIFDKIVSGDIPSDKIHDDEHCIAFRDVSPQAPVHFLVIPKNRDGLTQLSKAREDQKQLLGHLMYVAQQLGQKECPGGFRITVNDGKDGAQSVYHLHLHVMGGRQMQWPPG